MSIIKLKKDIVLYYNAYTFLTINLLQLLYTKYN